LKREFAFNIFFLLLINLLIKPFYIFGIESKVQQAVGDAAFGLYFSLFGLVFLHQFINDPGIQNYNSVFVAQNREKVIHHFPRLMGIKLLLLITMLASVLLSSLILGYNLDAILLLILIVLVLFLSGMFVLLRSMLSSLGNYKADTWLSGIDRLILVLVLGALLYMHITFTIYHFVLIQIGVYLLCVVGVALLLSSKKLSFVPVFDKVYNLQFLKSCLPYTLIIFLTAIIMRGDGVIIERMLSDGKVQAGIYAKGYRFLDAANMFGYLFGALLLPMYANKIGHKKEIGELFHIAYNMLLFLSTCIAMVFYVYRFQIFSLFYGHADAATIEKLVPLIFAILPVAMTNVFGPLIVSVHKVKVYNKLFLFAVIIYLTANIICVPIYGIYAASMIAFISWSFVLIGMVSMVYFYGLVDFDNKIIVDSIKIIASVVIPYALIKNLEFHWILSTAVIGIVSLVLLVFTKVLPIRELLRKENR
jgi:O-antigen/teichoic acid export membrane protein